MKPDMEKLQQGVDKLGQLIEDVSESLKKQIDTKRIKTSDIRKAMETLK